MTELDADNQAKWIKYWRGCICEAMDTTDTTLAAQRLDAVIFELAEWVEYSGFSTPFVASNLNK